MRLPDAPRRLIHQGAHIRRGRVADVDDEVGVLLGDHRTATPVALQPDGFDEAAGELARRVLEDRSGVRIAERLMRLAPALGVGAFRTDRRALARMQQELRRA